MSTVPSTTKTDRTKGVPTPTRAQARAAARAARPFVGNPFQASGTYRARHRSIVEANRGGGRERAAKLFAHVPSVTVLHVGDGASESPRAARVTRKRAIRLSRRTVTA